MRIDDTREGERKHVHDGYIQYIKGSNPSRGKTSLSGQVKRTKTNEKSH